MSIPVKQQLKIGAYIVRKMMNGAGRFPIVLMLEPLFQCNLNCKGCGKIAQSEDILKKRMSIAECVEAAEESGAPVVSLAGGEPLIHDDIHLIARELTDRKRFVYLCTNSLLVKKRINDFKPSPYLTFNIHLDGMHQVHDRLTCREGVFENAVNSIKLLLSKGFRVTTNTTLFEGEPPEHAVQLFDFITSLGIEGMTISPGFSYEKASDRESFLRTESVTKLFKDIFRSRNGKKWQFNHSSLYLDFLSGNQNYSCMPWATPTRNVLGWQRPCYLLNDGYVSSFKALIDDTDWPRYGKGNDPRCADCMCHCGFEPTAVFDALKHPMKNIMVKIRN